ncbi:hypothetical protein PENTCL1PPCAC_28566, partial [Pristionchus entomophagus]
SDTSTMPKREVKKEEGVTYPGDACSVPQPPSKHGEASRSRSSHYTARQFISPVSTINRPMPLPPSHSAISRGHMGSSSDAHSASNGRRKEVKKEPIDDHPTNHQPNKMNEPNPPTSTVKKECDDEVHSQSDVKEWEQQREKNKKRELCHRHRCLLIRAAANTILLPEVAVERIDQEEQKSVLTKVICRFLKRPAINGDVIEYTRIELARILEDKMCN